MKPNKYYEFDETFPFYESLNDDSETIGLLHRDPNEPEPEPPKKRRKRYNEAENPEETLL